jgi:hypothetical protein
LIVPRATILRTSGLNTLSAHDSSPVDPYTEIVSIRLLHENFRSPDRGSLAGLQGGRESLSRIARESLQIQIAQATIELMPHN